MDRFKRHSVFILLAFSFAFGKNTFTSFSLAPAFPVSEKNAQTPTGPKAVTNGWEAAWTFFGKPFTSIENGLSPLAFGGKISYSRWLRDSTPTPITFLGMQAITRYYLPPFLKSINTFVEGGAGMFIGEYGFASVDTMTWSSSQPESVVFKGLRSFGFHIGIGVNWDVVEVVPEFSFVNTRDGMSAWFTINAAMTF